ncbi:MAG TPA: hypothetical protein VGU67_02755 [Edaphobacter sp.]|nr:hypothetical protein [Edaphobacter sp.]
MYNKLFAKILDSSIWLEDHATVRVWITFMAVMDEDGFCPFSSPTNLAKRAGVTLSETKAALDKLEGPDEFSSDPTNDGRRVERTDGGWIVLNAEKYRSQVTREEIRRQNKERQQRYRDKKKTVTQERDDVTLNRNESSESNADMGKRNGSVTQSVSEAVSRAEANQEQTHTPSAHKEAKKFAQSVRGMLSDLTDDSLGDLALEIACRHPWGRKRNWTPRNVGDADTKAILDAMTDEAQISGVTMAEAGRILLKLLDAWDDIPLDQCRYVASIPKFYKQGDYRLKPKDLINPQEGKNHGKRRGTDGNAGALQEFLAGSSPTGEGNRVLDGGTGRGIREADQPEDVPAVRGGARGTDAGADHSGLQPGNGREPILSKPVYPARIQWPRRNG